MSNIFKELSLEQIYLNITTKKFDEENIKNSGFIKLATEFIKNNALNLTIVPIRHKAVTLACTNKLALSVSSQADKEESLLKIIKLKLCFPDVLLLVDAYVFQEFKFLGLVLAS